MRLNGLAAAVLLNVALAVALAWLWTDQTRVRWAEPTALPPALVGVAVAPSVRLVLSRYRDTLERPLFSASRRAAPPPGNGEDGQAASSLKGVRLLGTYSVGERGGILIARDGKVERLPIGASIGDWKVAGEDGRGAALVRASGEREKLELALDTTPPAGAQTAGTPAGQNDSAAAVQGSEQPGGAGAAQIAAPRRPTPAASPTEAQRRQLERINARRAVRGLPPLPAQ